MKGGNGVWFFLGGGVSHSPLPQGLSSPSLQSYPTPGSRQDEAGSKRPLPEPFKLGSAEDQAGPAATQVARAKAPEAPIGRRTSTCQPSWLYIRTIVASRPTFLGAERRKRRGGAAAAAGAGAGRGGEREGRDGCRCPFALLPAAVPFSTCLPLLPQWGEGDGP